MRRQRILIGVLDTPLALRRARDDLATCGADREDMLVVTDAAATSRSHEHHVPKSVKTTRGLAVHVRRMTSGVPDGGSRHMPQIERWIASGLSEEQEKRLRSGGAMLMVWVRTAEQERLCSETMLVHSVVNVQLHDI